jgi:hypothetical protein
MVTEAVAEKLERRYAVAQKRIVDLSSKRGQLSTRNGAEAEYAQAYQALVRVGLRPQIRKKYRSRG